jgi:hypothetical protein
VASPSWCELPIWQGTKASKYRMGTLLRQPSLSYHSYSYVGGFATIWFISIYKIKGLQIKKRNV